MKVGARLGHPATTTEVIVTKAPTGDVVLTCGGVALVAKGEDVDEAAVLTAGDAGTLLGKRYRAADIGLEVLCTKGGDGTLRVGDVPLEIREAKSLPSSD